MVKGNLIQREGKENFMVKLNFILYTFFWLNFPSLYVILLINIFQGEENLLKDEDLEAIPEIILMMIMIIPQAILAAVDITQVDREKVEENR